MKRVLTVCALISATIVMAPAHSSENPNLREYGRQYHQNLQPAIETFEFLEVRAGEVEVFRDQGLCKTIENLSKTQDVKMPTASADVWQVRRSIEVYKIQGASVRVSPCAGLTAL